MSLKKPILLAALTGLVLLGVAWVRRPSSAPSDPLACLKTADCPMDAHTWIRFADSNPPIWRAALRHCLAPEQSLSRSCLPVGEAASIRLLGPAAPAPPPSSEAP